LVAEVQVKGEDNNGAEGQNYLACVTPDGYTFKVPHSAASERWIKKKMKAGELVSGRTKLDFGQQQGRAVKVNKAKQALEVADPPGLINNPQNENGSRRLAVVTGTRTVLAVRVVAGGGFCVVDVVDGSGASPNDLMQLF